MPIVHVHLAAGRPPEHRRALLEAVADAVASTLDVPRTATQVVLHEIPAEDYLAGTETLAERARAAGST